MSKVFLKTSMVLSIRKVSVTIFAERNFLPGGDLLLWNFINSSRSGEFQRESAVRKIHTRRVTNYEKKGYLK